MHVLVALYGSAVLVLIAAGGAKLARPRAAADLIGLLRLPARVVLARLAGFAEVLVGVVALMSDHPAVSTSVGVLYGAFAVVVLRALVAGVPSCGCFGDFDAPPSRIHVVGNLALAGVSLAAAGSEQSPAGATWAAMNQGPAEGTAFVLLTATLAGLVIVAFTALPEALHARSGPGRQGGMFRLEPGSALPLAASSRHSRTSV